VGTCSYKRHAVVGLPMLRRRRGLARELSSS
jgi:hypothetical protein